MSSATLEHANITVSDPARSAKMLEDVFGWHIRWQGEAISGGMSIHVGNENSYLAIYKGPDNGSAPKQAPDSYTTIGGLNHLAIVVEDLNAVKRQVIAAGYEPGEHQVYEPGERFYFRDHDHIEYEVVCYD